MESIYWMDAGDMIIYFLDLLFSKSKILFALLAICEGIQVYISLLRQGDYKYVRKCRLQKGQGPLKKRKSV